MVVTVRGAVICNDQRRLLSFAANVLWLHIVLPKLFLNQGISWVNLQIIRGPCDYSGSN
jgi:hypothetical protein